MRHWTDPRSRGVWDHPAAMPPRPMQNHHNDLGTRLARVEEHLNFGAQNMYRVEEESRMRATDLGQGISDLEDKTDGIDARVRALEQERHTNQSIWGMVTSFGTSAGQAVRYTVTVILTALVMSGLLTADKIAALKSIWGAAPPG